MKEVIRQCIGIDCAKGEHVASFSVMSGDHQIVHLSTLAFKNSKSGFEKLRKWILRQKPMESVTVVMEATGVYHEDVACYLTDLSYFVSVLLPNKARNFMKTLDVKSINDRIASQGLATMGLEKKLSRWEKPSPLLNQLRQLTRERTQIIQERTQIKCQLHAEKSGAWPNESSLKRMQKRLKVLEQQTLEVKEEIAALVKSDPELAKNIKLACSIPGVGVLTAITVFAETDNFKMVQNKKQLVSYAGLDVKHHSSGTSVNKKPRISKHGNKYLRKGLYFPALAAIRSDHTQKELFVRLVSKHGIKMKGAVAVQRKILVLIYTIWKNQTKYDPDYQKKISKNELGQSRKTALKELA